MEKSNYFRIIILIILLGVGCKKEDKGCPYMIDGSIRSISAPDSAKTGSTITISVVYDNKFNCENFHSFKSNTSGNTTTIWVQSEIDECNCNTDNEIKFPQFTYSAPGTPGISTVKVHVVDSIYYTETIVIY